MCGLSLIMASEAPEMQCQGCVRVWKSGTTEDIASKSSV